MAGTTKRLLGPLFLSTSYLTNLYNQASAGLYTVVRKVHVANKTNTQVTLRLYIGAAATNLAGTEWYFDYPVAPFSEFNIYGALRLESTDFLVGGASIANALIITIEGDLVVT